MLCEMRQFKKRVRIAMMRKGLLVSRESSSGCRFISARRSMSRTAEAGVDALNLAYSCPVLLNKADNVNEAMAACSDVARTVSHSRRGTGPYRR